MRSLRALLDRALNSLARVGADASDDEETRLRKALLVLIAVLVLPISLTWSALYLIFGGPVGLTALLYFVISVASIAVFARTRDYPWGDAVNTASRMESQGSPNRVQITRATYELLDGEFECEPRGTISIKGKGDMDTWYLVGRRATAPVAGAAPVAGTVAVAGGGIP